MYNNDRSFRYFDDDCMSVVKYIMLLLSFQVCPAGTFGLDCLNDCHCSDNDNCSNVNGDCDGGICHPDWGSAGCQISKFAVF